MKDIVDELTKESIGPCEKRHSGCSAIASWLLQKLGPLKTIEIGTSYGRQLPTFAPYVSKLICVDPMYNWVPNVQEVEGFEPERVDQNKIDTWTTNAEPWKDKIELVIGNSFLVHKEPDLQEKFAGTQLLIIDGCHHPAESVMKDYENFRKFMTHPHYVIWDDIDMGDVQKAADSFGGHYKDMFNARLVYF